MTSQKAIDRQTLVGAELDERIAELCGLTPSEFKALERDHDEALMRAPGATAVEEDDADAGEQSITQSETVVQLGNSIWSWAIGVAFGRFDWRLAMDERVVPTEPGVFDPLPSRSPGMLPEGDRSFHIHSGILVDDQGHPHDLAHLVEEVAKAC